MIDLMLTDSAVLDNQINYLLLEPKNWLEDIEEQFKLDSINVLLLINRYQHYFGYQQALINCCQVHQQETKRLQKILKINLQKIKELTDLNHYHPSNSLLRSLIGTAIISLKNSYITKLGIISETICQQIAKLKEDSFIDRQN